MSGSTVGEAGGTEREIQCTLSELGPVEIGLVNCEAEAQRWREFVNRYHWLGEGNSRGMRLRYLIHGRGRPIAAMGWQSGSLKLQARDCFIGWTDAQRGRYLAQVINNDRFVIADWLRVKNLASYILAAVVRRLPEEWESRYGIRPYVLETFVDPTRHRGSCYRAAGWRSVGTTKGYARLHRSYAYHGRIKEVYLYVVEPEFRRIIGCRRRSCPQKRSRIKERRERLRMMIQEVGYDPALIDWAELEGAQSVMAQELVEFHDLFRDCFRRPEPRLLGQTYLTGLLSDIGRKNVEKIALTFSGPTSVRCLQNFLSRYPWSDELMLERYQGLFAQTVGEEDGMYTIDASEMEKKGKESVGVARQYCGHAGKTENCQSGVFIGYTAGKGYGLIDCRLYMPKIWFEEDYRRRRQQCAVPPEVEFQSKNQIALALLQKQIERGVLQGKWVGCDSDFGRDHAVRDAIDRWGKYYLAGIRADMKVWLLEGHSELGRQRSVTVSQLAGGGSLQWETVVLAEGAKGPIVAELAIVRVRENNSAGKPARQAWLIVRRKEDGALQYYLSNAPADIPPRELHRALTMRWPIEQCFEDGKKHLGMDHYEHRTWNSWHRHMLYVFLAMFFLLRLRLKFKKNSNPHPSSGPEPDRRGPGTAAVG
ncbi:MAG: IS701 family transposase [Armatimonadetes bacterium]|nr:IS701 family transposase [Armatimonadota bacterium]